MVVSKKDRKHSGRERGRTTLKYSKSFIINNCLEPREYYNEWNNYRDGYRDDLDKTKLRKFKSKYIDWWFDYNKWNQKIKKLLQRRRARKDAKKIKEQTRPR